MFVAGAPLAASTAKSRAVPAFSVGVFEMGHEPSNLNTVT
ncbi:hypothetical protein YSA_08850 [Pseudomonas putida ND6]|uniref:Uncharacterized protein n=1 Tax=Pseudomonas putida ND6 TaxID=231023 RepID=I3V1D5_PSEPU|nr:hypothetical protein YSA_08850 [Pseudomonas putida ND6]